LTLASRLAQGFVDKTDRGRQAEQGLCLCSNQGSAPVRRRCFERGRKGRGQGFLPDEGIYPCGQELRVIAVSTVPSIESRIIMTSEFQESFPSTKVRLYRSEKLPGFFHSPLNCIASQDIHFPSVEAGPISFLCLSS
jgi:hypothetical protein